MLAELAAAAEEDQEDATPLALAQPSDAFAAPLPRAPSRSPRTPRSPGKQGQSSRHGRRVNPRKGIPMHVMATYALLRLPRHEGNLTEMAGVIETNELFCSQLDWTPRPGTKTYPR